MPAYKVLTITPDMAQQFLNNAGLNAPINRRKVEQYKQQMLAGEWGLTYPLRGRTVDANPIHFFKGKLTNGQHRMTAVVESGVPIEVRVRDGRDGR